MCRLPINRITPRKVIANGPETNRTAPAVLNSRWDRPVKFRISPREPIALAATKDVVRAIPNATATMARRPAQRMPRVRLNSRIMAAPEHGMRPAASARANRLLGFE